MRRNELEAKLGGADPIDPSLIAGLARGPGGCELVEAILENEPGQEATELMKRRPRQSAVVLVAAAAAAAILILVLTVPRGDAPAPQSDPRPYGVELVRFAKETPLLLLRMPGWRVANVLQATPQVGEIHFVREGQVAQLNWRPGPYERWAQDRARESVGRGSAQVLGNSAQVFRYPCCGRSDLDITALWQEGGRVLEFRSPAPSVAVFERRLGSLAKVSPPVWLDAMPPRVLKAADRDRVVAGMLKELPLPPGFSAGDLPGSGLTTDRVQVAFEVLHSVACAWRASWLAAREEGDALAAQTAVRTMAAAAEWPLLRRSDREVAAERKGGLDWSWDIVYSGQVMPTGRWALHCSEFR